jgi:hypothetical protein
MEEAFGVVRNSFTRLPNNLKIKRQWTEQLAGMMLTLLGVATAQMIEPNAIPPSFIKRRGRPRKA